LPTQTANIPSSSCSPMLVSAAKPWVPLASHKVSYATDDKVVNPPKTPTKIKRRSFAVKIDRVSARPATNPIARHPKQLTASVPYGNNGFPRFCKCTCSASISKSRRQNCRRRHKRSSASNPNLLKRPARNFLVVPPDQGFRWLNAFAFSSSYSSS
jgi:hypothetical protein